MNDLIGIWLAALLTIIVYTYLLGDNFLYRLAEHLFVGSAAGYAVVVAYHSVLRPKLFARLGMGGLVYLLPLILGLLLLTKGRLRLAWMGNIPLAFLFGVGAAVAVGGAFLGTIQPQVYYTMVSLNPADYAQYGWEYVIDGLIIFIGTVGTLFYFHFSAGKDGKSRPGFVGFWARLGRWVIIIAFGAIFASAAMARLSVLIGRVQFLAERARDFLTLLPLP